MHHKASLTTYLACCIMITFSAFPASHMPTLTVSPPVEAETCWSSNCVLASWLRTPLQFATFSYSYVLAYIVILIEDFCCAKRLDFFWSKSHFTALLHARQLHGIASLDIDPQMVCNTVDTELMATAESKKVLFVILIVAHVAEASLPIITRYCLPINKILVETFSQ